ncbi:MAG: hypothetical protein GWN58_28975, partial [Anaerolineae bacterium]|nr:hypothetical protein [Anaerolineae bacterium]
LTAADLFDIQAELAVAIVEAMRTTISPEDRALVQETPTENMAAYAAYLRAMQLAQNRGFVGLYNLDVVRALEEAVELDPEFAEAWAQLSIWRTTVAGPTRDPEIAEAALAALMRVRSLRPDLLEAELAWAEYLYRIMREYGQAVEVLESLGDRVAGHAQALELKSWLYRRLGRYREAYQVGLDVVQLEPRSPTVAVFIAMIAPLFDDCDTAEVYAQRALALAPELADIKSQVAHYELECNGDALRAQQLLKDLDLSVVFDIWRVALWAAIHLRDIDSLLSVIETE